MTTLFSEPVPSNSFVSPYLVSGVLHAVALSLVGFHVIESHRIIERFPGTDHFSVRMLELHRPQPVPARNSGSFSYSQVASATAGSSAAEGKSSAGSGKSASAALQLPVPRLMPAPHLLIQPEAPKNVVLPDKAPIPLLVLWGPEKVVVKRPTPPLPQTASISEVRPSLETPIREENLSEFKMAPSPFSISKIPTPVGTTSPIVVHGPEQQRKMPETTSISPQPKAPAPAKILSLSDVRVQEGAVAVPLANQGSPKANPGMTTPGVLHDPSPANASPAGTAGNGKATGDRPGADPKAQPDSGNGLGHSGNGTGAATSPRSGAGAASGKSTAPGTGTLSANGATQGPSGNGAQDGPKVFPAQGSGAGNSSGPPGGSVHISAPRDGQFGVVVIGSSIADQYPETASMWSGRMASTVYLHVGQPKSWIMQYALPSLIEASNPAGGRLEAPWPFEIVRPNLDPGDVDADAIILHGFVNEVGRLEKLQVVFPSQLTQAGMLTNMLNEWQFRPARLNSNPVAVEVLIIIPDQSQ